MKNKNVCLIIPPSPFLLDERVFLHLGILKVAANLEANGYKAECLDLSGVKNYLDVVRDYTKGECKTFGITASTPQIPYAVEICRTIKDADSNNKVILGGPHCTLMHSAAKREEKNGLHLSSRATKDTKKLLEIFDVLVCGDGEHQAQSAVHGGL